MGEARLNRDRSNPGATRHHPNHEVAGVALRADSPQIRNLIRIRPVRVQGRSDETSGEIQVHARLLAIDSRISPHTSNLSLSWYAGVNLQCRRRFARRR